MPMDAMRYFFELSNVTAPSGEIFCVRNWLDMTEVRIDAAARPATMVTFFASGNRTKKEFVDCSMQKFPFATASGVAIVIKIAQPEPATGVGLDVDLGL